MKQSKVITKPHRNNAPIPDCQNCITLAICKAHISTATNFDECMIAIDKLTKKCSILFNYTMDHLFIYDNIKLRGNPIRTYFSLNEDRAVQVFEIIIPRKGS